MDRGVDQLGDIVRRDRGRHADRDPARAVGQQVREQPGENLGLFFLAIVGRAKLDRAVVEAGHQLHRDGRQPGLGVAIGRGVIAVDIAEIPLPVDERVAEREILREADHRVIDALVAVRVIFADHVADDARRLLVGAGRIEPKQAHRPQQPPVDRLQPVADVGQRARGDRRQRIDEIAFGKRGIERGFDDRREFGISHGRCLASLSRASRGGWLGPATASAADLAAAQGRLSMSIGSQLLGSAPLVTPDSMTVPSSSSSTRSSSSSSSSSSPAGVVKK